MELAVGERIIALVDMDCFYVQVEQKLNPGYDKTPCTVSQYNTWQGGGVIAVNYEARAFGVKRGMRGEQTKKLCPNIHNFFVPEVRGKADLTRYRDAGASVLEVLCEFCDCVERASVDEAYLDLTAVVAKKIEEDGFSMNVYQLPNTFVVGWDKEKPGDDVKGWLDSINEDHTLNEQKLAVAASIVEKMRAAVYDKTTFRCSAGIAHNKMLAKLACGINKPNKQTIVPHSSVPLLYKKLPIHKVRNLGGKLGEEVKQKLGAETMADLAKYSENQLHINFGEKTGSWLYSISRGIEHDPVTARQLPKSIGCGKNFPGKGKLDTLEKVSHWLGQLSIELEERLQKDKTNNKRVARSFSISIRSLSGENNTSVVVSRACPIPVYDASKIAADALRVIQKQNTASPNSLLWKPPILSLALSAGKFEDQLDMSSCNIHSYFTKMSPKKPNDNEAAVTEINDSANEIHSTSTKNVKKLKPVSKKHIETYLIDNNGPVTHDTTESGVSLIDTESEDDTKGLDKSSIPCGANIGEDIETSRNLEALCEVIDEEEMPPKITKGFFSKKLEERELASNSVDYNSSAESDSTKRLTDLSSDEQSMNLDLKTDKSKSNVEKTDLKKLGSLQFFQPRHSNPGCSTDENDLVLLSPDVTFVCEKCEKRVAIWEEQEHSDYHLAKEIQKENVLLIKQPSAQTTKPKPMKITRKKRQSKNESLHTNKKSKPLVNTLDSFFK